SRSNSWNRTVRGATALYRRTGMFTKPNPIDPVQIALAILDLHSRAWGLGAQHSGDETRGRPSRADPSFVLASGPTWDYGVASQFQVWFVPFVHSLVSQTSPTVPPVLVGSGVAPP